MDSKRGALALQYIFLIFIATVVAFIIIGMVGKWSLKSNRFISTMFGGEKNVALDNQIINVTNHGLYVNEVVKHAKICYEKGKEGKLEGRQLCYTLIFSDGKFSDKGAVNNALSIPHDLKVEVPANKIVVSFNPSAGEVVLI